MFNKQYKLTKLTNLQMSKNSEYIYNDLDILIRLLMYNLNYVQFNFKTNKINLELESLKIFRRK